MLPGVSVQAVFPGSTALNQKPALHTPVRHFVFESQVLHFPESTTIVEQSENNTTIWSGATYWFQN